MTAPPPFTPGVRHWLLGSCGGLLLWASSFVTLYALLSLGCEAGWHARAAWASNHLTLALTLAWAVHLLALGALLAWMVWRWPGRGVLPLLGRTLTIVALLATVWTGWPVLVLPPCAGLAPATSLPAALEAPCSMT
jgi:hypothetical protein